MEHIFRNYIKNKSNKENNNGSPPIYRGCNRVAVYRDPIDSIPKIDVKKKDYDSIVKLVDNDDNKPIITPIAKQKKR